MCSSTLEWGGMIYKDISLEHGLPMAHYTEQKNGIAEWEAKKKKMGNKVFFKK